MTMRIGEPTAKTSRLAARTTRSKKASTSQAKFQVDAVVDIEVSQEAQALLGAESTIASEAIASTAMLSAQETRPVSARVRHVLTQGTHDLTRLRQLQYYLLAGAVPRADAQAIRDIMLKRRAKERTDPNPTSDLEGQEILRAIETRLAIELAKYGLSFES